MAYSDVTAMKVRDALERIPKSVTHLSDKDARQNKNLERRSDSSGSKRALGVAVTEKRMMGGLIFLIGNNMTLGIKTLKSGIEQFMFRVGKDREAEALAIAGTRPMIHGNRRMPGFLFIDADVCDDAAFDRLVAMARDYTSSLAPK